MASKDKRFVDDDPDLMNQQRKKTPSPTHPQTGGPQTFTGAQGTNPILRPSPLNPDPTAAQKIADMQHKILAQQQEIGKLQALQNARQLQPPTLAHPAVLVNDADVEDLVGRLNRVTVTPPPAIPAPATTALKPKVFTTDQERTAYMLQKETEQTRTLVTAISSIAKVSLAGQLHRNLGPEQTEEFTKLTNVIASSIESIRQNELILGQMINPNVGKSKQSLDAPTILRAPADYRRHHTVMQTTMLRDNINVFESEIPTSDIVRTWTQMKKYGEKHYFNEDDYIEAWSKVTKGDALQQYNNMIQSKYNLTQILKFWQELYSKSRSITEQQDIIDSFIRHKAEALTAAMLRVTVIIDQMAYAEDPLAWPGIRDKQRRDVLMRIVTDKTRWFLKSRRVAHEDNGYLMTVDEMINDAHNFEQSYHEMPTQNYPIRTAVPLAANSMDVFGINAFNPKPYWPQSNVTPMETDQPAPQTFNPQVRPPQYPQQQQQQRGRSREKRPYDKNRPQSQSPGKYNDNRSNPNSRNNSQNNRNGQNQRPRTQSPFNKNDGNQRRQSQERPRNDQRPLTPSSQQRQQPQNELAKAGLVRGPMTSDGGTSALTLNIGDQNQYYQCNANKYCNKQHIWPKNIPTPDFCPENPSNQKN